LAVLNRIKRAINAFRLYEDNSVQIASNLGPSSYGLTPSFRNTGPTNERSILTSIYTRIAIDVAGINLRHILTDDSERYVDVIDSNLNLCLNFEPNMDQGPRHFRQNIVNILIERGVAAIVPVDSSKNKDGTLEIYTLRVGEITQWYSHHVRVNLYNEAKGVAEEIILEKRMVAIVENPLNAVMNAPNSTLQRLVRKLGLLDNVDETSAGRLDMIIQLPYVIKTEARREQAEARRKDIEFQLKESQYGIAYADGSEKITQLNRPVENTLLKQVEYLTGLLYTQLGITPTVMDGTADEAAMLNYLNRTVEPILDAIKEAMIRSFLGPFKYAKGERILYFKDPFKLVPISDVAEIADKFSRNEILSPNEIRGFMGIIPSKDPKADALINSNMPQTDETMLVDDGTTDVTQSALDDIDSTLDDVFSDIENELDNA
jgi:hypothetical protein